jgi:uncharacterized membrane protein
LATFAGIYSLWVPQLYLLVANAVGESKNAQPGIKTSKKRLYSQISTTASMASVFLDFSRISGRRPLKQGVAKVSQKREFAG